MPGKGTILENRGIPSAPPKLIGPKMKSKSSLLILSDIGSSVIKMNESGDIIWVFNAYPVRIRSLFIQNQKVGFVYKERLFFLDIKLERK